MIEFEKNNFWFEKFYLEKAYTNNLYFLQNGTLYAISRTSYDYILLVMHLKWIYSSDLKQLVKILKAAREKKLFHINSLVIFISKLFFWVNSLLSNIYETIAWQISQ